MNSNTFFETERLMFREFTMQDLETCHAYGKEPSVSEFQSWGPNNETDTKNFLASVINDQQNDPRKSYEFAVVEKHSQRHIGGAGIRVKPTMHNEADIGYSLNPEFWKQGYGTEVSREVIKFGFELLKLNRIWALVHLENKGSIRVLEKSKLVREGIQRQGMFVRGEYVDCYLYAILKSDYQT